MAQAYINTFRSRAGLSAEHAVQAEHTGIVSGQLGVSPQVEHRLRDSGCHVDRIVGQHETGTKQESDDLVSKDERFQRF